MQIFDDLMDILNGSNHQVHACNCCNFFRSINDVFQRKKKQSKSFNYCNMIRKKFWA